MQVERMDTKSGHWNGCVEDDQMEEKECARQLEWTSSKRSNKWGKCYCYVHKVPLDEANGAHCNRNTPTSHILCSVHIAHIHFANIEPIEYYMWEMWMKAHTHTHTSDVFSFTFSHCVRFFLLLICSAFAIHFYGWFFVHGTLCIQLCAIHVYGVWVWGVCESLCVGLYFIFLSVSENCWDSLATTL